MRLDIPGYYEFNCRVRIVAGHQSLERIPGILNATHARRPMIVTDRGVVTAGLVQTVMEAIGGGCEVGAVADDVPPDSDVHVVHALARLYT
ncbi:MAG: iron-containing alcohol dehydrogenase, partial [Syntrophales bacterium]|nr:iron-containing alcohol dehydrogenase [Syntrophales bacterium]